MAPPNVYAVQLDIAWEDKQTNYRCVQQLLEESGVVAGSLVVLPEMFATGFSMNLAITRQSVEREDELFLAELARRFAVTVIGGVVSPAPGDTAQNESVAFSPEGKLLARYVKIHP